MFSSFIPIDNTERSYSPPPVKPIFTNKMRNGNGYVNGKRPLENDEQIENTESYKQLKKIKN